MDPGPPAPAGWASPAPPSTTIEVVVPVYNEQASFDASIRRLHRCLTEERVAIASR